MYSVSVSVCAAHVNGLHSSVLGADFGLLDGEQVGSCDGDQRAATVGERGGHERVDERRGGEEDMREWMRKEKDTREGMREEERRT